MHSFFQYAALKRYAFVCDNLGHQPITDDRTFVSQSQRSAERHNRDAAAELSADAFRAVCDIQRDRRNLTPAFPLYYFTKPRDSLRLTIIRV